MFSASPLDILYIVLSFCILWFTAAVFWFLWQLARMMKHVNDTIAEARDMMHKIEQALTGIREKFERASSLVGLGANTAAKAVEYALEKKKRRMEEEMMEEEDDRPLRKPAYRRKKK